MDVLIIGGGNMGKTFAQSFLNAKVLRKENIHILDKDPLKIDLLSRFQLGKIYGDAGAYIKDMKIIILAVKPQDTHHLYAQIKPYISEEQIVLTIMAGVTIATIQKELGAPKVIRAMPNLPAQIGVGMTVFSASKEVPEKELRLVHELIDTTGKAIQVDDEDMLNAATAISGSGPAYVFYFMDTIIQSAINMGFTYAEASIMAEQTFLGAVYLYKRSNLSCDQWIEKVASRGGTTEAAISVFEQENVTSSIMKGVERALERSRELSNV
ncbi:MAG: pyrroline-5-carboxylate reductase [Bacteroidetes bacterium]|nr:pyrroline-5-carboxylate reductase [Bacteroidota bacterium]